MTAIRLQKILASAGFGSRRACEDLIVEGHVTVDGERVTELGSKADPQTQEIRCGGRRVRAPEFVYLAVNKPRGQALTPEFVRGIDARLLPVGRLEKEADGLLVLTNDGAFANMLAHPRYRVPRTYRVVLGEAPRPEVLERLRKGVWLSEGKTAPVDVRGVGRSESGGAVVEVTLNEALNREIFRVFARYGIKVKRLTRISIGGLTLGRLAPGHVRPIEPREVRELRDIVQREGS